LSQKVLFQTIKAKPGFFKVNYFVYFMRLNFYHWQKLSLLIQIFLQAATF